MPNDEYMTPSWIIDAARDVVGERIKFDPACSHYAATFQLPGFYRTKEAVPDGLGTDWHKFNSIWLNPPYSKPKPWIEKFIDWIAYNDLVQFVRDGFALINSNTETSYYQDLLKNCDAMCFFNRRISFLIDGYKRANNRNCQTLFYAGNNAEKFIEKFSNHGFCLELNK